MGDEEEPGLLSWLDTRLSVVREVESSSPWANQHSGS